MKCIILAAGYATRLYPLTENFPKPLLDVGGSTVLDRLTEDVSPAVDEFVVVTNHKFVRHFSAWAETKAFPVRVIDDGTVSNETRLGAVKDLALGLKDSTDDVLVMAGDNVLDFSLKGFIAFFQEKKASCVMTHEENDPNRLRRTAVITFDRQRLITSFEEKPAVPRGHHAVPPFYCYTAADVLRVHEALRSGCAADAPGSFAAWLAARVPVYAWEMPGKRYDIGDLNSYGHVRELFGTETVSGI